MLRKLFIFVFIIFSSLIYSQNSNIQGKETDEIAANVYFDYPVNNSHYQLSSSGSVGVNYHIRTVSYWYVVDWYGARIQYPNGTWSSWQDGQSGGWVLTTPGTYHIHGKVHVKYDLSGRSDYFMDSNILTFYVDPYIPTPPLSATMSGPTTLPLGQYGTYTTTPTGGHPPYTYQWSYYIYCPDAPISNGSGETDEIPCDYWGNISNTTNTVVKHCPGSDFSMRCKVTDAWGSTFTVTKFVNVPLGKKTINYTGSKETPSKLSLSSYPNPFNPSTAINVTIPNSGMVSLKIYDILGREVAVLVNEVLEVGKYEYEFNASSLPSGTYISALTTNNGTITQKLLLVK